MNTNLLAILHALAAPGATLRVMDLSSFGFLLPVCGVEGTYDNPLVDYAQVKLMEAAGYIAVIERPRSWKTVYQVTIGGMEALAAANVAANPPDNKPIMDIPSRTWAQYSASEWYMWEPGQEYLATKLKDGWSWTAQTMTTPAEVVMTAHDFRPRNWTGYPTAEDAMRDCDYLLHEMRDTWGT